MFKKFIAIVATVLTTTVASAAVDLNKATQAELESVKGIGPSLSTRILDERKKGDFKDWSDLVVRVKGIGEGNATRFSDAGLLVNGAGYKATAAAPKVEAKPAAAKTAPPAAKPEAKADARK